MAARDVHSLIGLRSPTPRSRFPLTQATAECQCFRCISDGSTSGLCCHYPQTLSLIGRFSKSSYRSSKVVSEPQRVNTQAREQSDACI